MTDINTADVGFEKQIWDAACVLRGNMDASEYKNVILGLIFLKYISDSFEEKHQALVEEGAGFEEDRDEYTADNIFFVPKGARWEDISAAAHTPEIGKTIDDAMIAIENENTSLKGILPKNFARPELDKRRLGDVVDLFTNIKMSDQSKEKDLLGRTYEYCLRNFAEQEGKNAGQFYTPSCVVRTIVEILQPFNGRVYDPCCGAGGMFVQSAKFVESHQGNINNISVFGQESNPTTWKIAKMNLAIRGIDANLGEIPEDTFLSDQHPTMKADFIMANPPFNDSNWGADKLAHDQRWKYGLPPNSNANFAWLQHMIWHLAQDGRMGVVLGNSALSINNGIEADIRKKIIEDDLIECVVSLPAHLFYSTKIKVSLWFLNKNKNKNQKNKILFIDTKTLGHMSSRTLREFSEDDIAYIASTVDKFRNEDNFENIPGFCKCAKLSEIRNRNYVITPSIYISGSVDAPDIEDLSDIYIPQLTSIKNLRNLISDSMTTIDNISKKQNSKNNNYKFNFVDDLSLPNIFELNTNDLLKLQHALNDISAAKRELHEVVNQFTQSLFKYWFIDYNFPDDFGYAYSDNGDALIDSDYGKIPADWNCMKMGTLLKPSNDRVGSIQGIEEYSVTNIGIFPRNKKFSKEISSNSTKNKLVRRGNLVFGMSREILNFGIMKDEVGSVSPAYHVYCVDETQIIPDFLEIYMRICSDYFLSLIKPGTREGQVLDKDELREKIILVPRMDIQLKYMLVIQYYSKLISKEI